jgi:hypothetical protein
MRVGYGRSLIVTTPQKQVRSIRAKNYSISAAMNKNGVIYFKSIAETYNGERFVVFYPNYLQP